MAVNNIDYSKNVGKKNEVKTFNKKQLLRKLHNVSPKLRSKLEVQLSDNKAEYHEDTINSANKLLDLLNDEGIVYDLMARNDGGGLLAKTKGLGGNDLIITIAPKDEYRINRGTKQRELQSSELFVGNINANGRNFYIDRNNQVKKSFDQYRKKNNIKKGHPEWGQLWAKYYNDERVKDFDENRYKYLLKGLIGELPVTTEYLKGNARKDVSFDNSYTILNEQDKPIVKFYRRKIDDEYIESNIDYISAYLIKKEEANQSVAKTPLLQMVEDTNKQIDELVDENGVVTRENKGFVEESVINPISIDDDTTLNGLNLDTLLAFNSRSDIAEAIAYEMRHNEMFTIDNDAIVGEPGLKDLLYEETAGVRADRISVNELVNNDEYLTNAYNQVIEDTTQTLNRLGVVSNDIYFDEDFVLHWEGVNKKDGTIRTGEIGQIFLPNEKGVISTEFKTVKDSADRNYHLVAGYTAYYKSNDKETTVKPKTISIQLENGKDIDVVASTEMDEEGNLKPFLTKNGKYVRADRLPEDELIRLNTAIDSYNSQHQDAPLPKVDTLEVKRTLKDRLRLKGFDQNFNKQLNATLARQILQEDDHSVDNVSLNKLYHGDVYGMRIASENLNKSAIIETYKNRVKFENEVLDLSMQELDSDYEGNDTDYEGEDYSHRFNIAALDGLFDRSMSSDGANLGLVRYLNKNTKILKNTGEVVPSLDKDIARATIIDEMPFTEADPGDRSMMGANQFMKSRNVSQSVVALMTYKGYTFEDGAVISKRFAEQQGEIVNGLDDEGNVIPLQVGDKISDLHGNKATISYIANENDDVFKENPTLDVIMNPHSIPSRMNTGVALELEAGGLVTPITFNGERVADAGLLNVVITDITAKGKTKVYEDEYDKDGNLIKKSNRKGRSFGVQEAWVANALELDNTMKEIYSQNIQPFEKMKAYMNVTGLSFDENTAILQSNGFNNGKHRPPEGVNEVEISEALKLPEDEAFMELPIEVELPSGMKTKYLYVLPEKYRSTQELFDGDRMYHDYSSAYSRITKESLKYSELQDKFKVTINKKLENLNEQDLMNYDLTKDEDRIALRKQLTNSEDIKEFDQQINKMNNSREKQASIIQGKVNSLTSRIIEDKLGGHSKLSERLDEYGDSHMFRSKDSKAIKQSIIKKEIMSKQVPNSVTSVVTAEPNVDIDTIKVSSDIYKTLDLKNPEDRVLLWRDPALHDGSMRAFKVIKDDNLVGVGINPLVTESFGMDFDGDTVGVYAPKTKEAQLELREKAALEKNLIDPTSLQFTGNIAMDFVSSAVENGYVYSEKFSEIEKGPLKDVTVDDEFKNLSPKDQLTKLLTNMAKKDNGHIEINQLWKDVVTSNENIGTSQVAFSNRTEFYNSIMDMATKGAKGKPDGIINQDVENNIKKYEKENGKTLTYAERMENPELYISNQSTVMDYYDRGKEMAEYKANIQEAMKQPNINKDGQEIDKQAIIEHNKDLYKKLYAPYKEVVNENGSIDKVRNKGSLAYDQDRTRMAQSGKTDLTGLAGAKSQTLVSLMYDKSGGAMSAMEVTEPLTQATLKLKHDPKKTPEIKKLLADYDEMLSKGGYDRDEFKQEFQEMYSKVGLDVRDEHLDDVYNVLSNKNEDGQEKTAPIQEVIEERMNPLMKANLYGYDILKESAIGVEKNTEVTKNQWEKQTKDIDDKWILKDEKTLDNGNMSKLKHIALGKVESNVIELNTLKKGDKSELHIPNDIKSIGVPCSKEVASSFAKENNCGIYKKEQSKTQINKPLTNDLGFNNKSKKGFDNKGVDDKSIELEM